MDDLDDVVERANRGGVWAYIEEISRAVVISRPFTIFGGFAKRRGLIAAVVKRPPYLVDQKHRLRLNDHQNRGGPSLPRALVI
jgi:hypothetical protein